MRVRGHPGKELELYSKSGDKSAVEMRHMPLSIAPLMLWIYLRCLCCVPNRVEETE